jgi:hypothetical protein
LLEISRFLLETMVLRRIIAFICLLCHASLIDANSSSIEDFMLRRRNEEVVAQGVGNNKGDEDFSDWDYNGVETPSTPTILAPTIVPNSQPSAPITPNANPNTMPTAPPTTIISSSQSVQPSASTSNSTPAPTMVGERTTEIIPLLPFDISLRGEEEQFDEELNIDLKLALEFFLLTKLKERFDNLEKIMLINESVESDARRLVVQRKTWSFSGEAEFINDGNVPTEDEVHQAQEDVFSEFSFELKDILNENDVAVDIDDIKVKKEDGDKQVEKASNDVSPTLWVILGASTFLSILVFIFLRQRNRRGGSAGLTTSEGD